MDEIVRSLYDDIRTLDKATTEATLATQKAIRNHGESLDLLGETVAKLLKIVHEQRELLNRVVDRVNVLSGKDPSEDESSSEGKVLH
jgi:hypothetical protein